jgi:hypothetical protein
MFLKMDMEKAFDRMEWSFLLAILEQLGFSPQWIAWVRICISTAFFFFFFFHLVEWKPFWSLFP